MVWKWSTKRCEHSNWCQYWFNLYVSFECVIFFLLLMNTCPTEVFLFLCYIIMLMYVEETDYLKQNILSRSENTKHISYNQPASESNLWHLNFFFSFIGKFVSATFSILNFLYFFYFILFFETLIQIQNNNFFLQLIDGQVFLSFNCFTTVIFMFLKTNTNQFLFSSII